MSEPPQWAWSTLGLYTAYLATAYVAGFLVLVVPGGLGVREFFLTLFLVPELAPCVVGTRGAARAAVVLAVLLLRLVLDGGRGGSCVDPRFPAGRESGQGNRITRGRL